jgi:hypothetical protein
LAIQVHRHRCSPTSIVTEYMAGSTFSTLTENENRRSILGYKQHCMPAWLHFRHFVTSMPAPVASGWSDRRVGLAPTGKAPPCHGARGLQTFGAAADITSRNQSRTPD